MKILVLSDLWHPFPGGAESYIRRVTEFLASAGHEIHILTSYAKAKASLPMTIRDIGVYGRHAHGVQVIESVLAEQKPDLILTHHFFCGEFASELSRWGIPFVEISHNRPRHPDARLTIFNSEFTASRCNRRPDDIVLLPPIDKSCVAFSGIAQFFRPYIGHIKPLGGKGIALTYKLAEYFLRRNREFDHGNPVKLQKFLVLRGEWQDGEDIRQLPNVEFMEPVDDIREFYSKCRLVLMPSLSEDAGTVPQECAANRIPCISSNVGGLPETNQGGVILAPGEENWLLWADAIHDLGWREGYDALVRRREWYTNVYNWPKRLKEIEGRIRQCVSA